MPIILGCICLAKCALIQFLNGLLVVAACCICLAKCGLIQSIGAVGPMVKLYMPCKLQPNVDSSWLYIPCKMWSYTAKCGIAATVVLLYIPCKLWSYTASLHDIVILFLLYIPCKLWSYTALPDWRFSGRLLYIYHTNCSIIQLDPTRLARP